MLYRLCRGPTLTICPYHLLHEALTSFFDIGVSADASGRLYLGSNGCTRRRSVSTSAIVLAGRNLGHFARLTLTTTLGDGRLLEVVTVC